MNKIEAIQKVVDTSGRLLSQGRTTFRDIYEAITSENSKEIAIIHHEAEGQVREYTYDQYARTSKSVARKLSVLLADRRIKNAVVAIKLKNSPAWCFIFWGVLMSGYRPILIDAKLAKENTQNLLKNSKAVAIITDDGNTYDKVTTLTKGDINDISEDLNFNPTWADEVIFCSSGTTGDIKLMIYNGLNMVHQLNASRDMPRENQDIIYPKSLGKIRIIGLIPFHHIFAFVAIFLWYSFYNTTLVFTDFNDPVTLVKDIRELEVTHLYHVPLFFEVVSKNFIAKLDSKQKEKMFTLISYNLGKIPLKKAGLLIHHFNNELKKKLFGTQIRYLISGGGTLNNATSEFFNGIGYPLYNGYGMTEVGVTSVELSMDVKDRIKRSIGRPLFGVSYKLSRQKELLIKSSITHIKEIVRGKEVNTKLNKDGYFASGDIATIDGDNRYYLKGRIKDVIIASNGENVYPDEIESYFKHIKGVANLAVFGARNKIVLVVETRAKIMEELEICNRALPLHKQVNEIVMTMEPLPLSSSLKVKRFKVKENYNRGLYQTTNKKEKKKKVNILAGYDKAQCEDVVRRLNKVYQAVLFAKKDIDGDAHWINDLHSDSMTYITLISEIEKEFVIKIPIEKYGKLTTLNEFAKEILDSSCK